MVCSASCRRRILALAAVVVGTALLWNLAALRTVYTHHSAALLHQPMRGAASPQGATSDEEEGTGATEGPSPAPPTKPIAAWQAGTAVSGTKPRTAAGASSAPPESIAKPAATGPAVPPSERCQWHQFRGAQKCPGDGVLYSCGCPLCNLSHKCASIKGLEGCACPLEVFPESFCSTRASAAKLAVNVAKTAPQVQNRQLFPALTGADAQEKFLVYVPDGDQRVGSGSFFEWFESNHMEQAIAAIAYKLLAPTSPYGYNPSEWMVFDFGMNRGVLTLLPARLGYDVVSVEVMPDCVQQALTSLKLNGLESFAHIYNVGGTAASGGWLPVQGNCDLSYSIYDPHRNHIVAGQNLKGGDGDVPLRTMPEIFECAPGGGDKGVALLKMDLEGSEMDILISGGIYIFAS